MSFQYYLISNVLSVLFVLGVVWFLWIRKLRASQANDTSLPQDSGAEIEKYSRDYDMTLIIRFVFGMLFLAVVGSVTISLLGKVLPDIFVSIFNFLENIALMIVTFYFSKHIPTPPMSGIQGGTPQQ